MPDDGWTEWHLTTAGWSAGATWTPLAGLRFAPRSPGAVLTVRSRAEAGRARAEVVYAILDANRIRGLVSVHGPAPRTELADPAYGPFR